MHAHDQYDAGGIARRARRTSRDGRLRARRRRPNAVTALALALALSAVPLVLSAPADASETDRIAAWMVVDGSPTSCQSLVTFKPDGTDLKVVVDCDDNELAIWRVGHVAWSPDGNRIAFFGEYLDEDSYSYGPFPHVVDADGENLTRVCVDFDCSDDSISSSLYNLSWGVDDHLYLSGNVIYRISMQDGATQIFDESSFSPDGNDQVLPWNVELSRDGRTLAFHDFKSVYMAPLADLTQFSVLTPLNGDVTHTTWHPLGTHIVYVSVSSDTLMSVSITEPFETTVLPTGDVLQPRSPSLSADGSQMVFFDRATRNVYVIALTGDDPTAVEILTAPGGGKFVGALSWSTPPQSRQVVTPAAPTVAVACAPLPAQVGATVTCSVTGGDPGIGIWWRASYNPAFAGAGVTLGADGTGTFSFVIPAAARGQEVMVELVEWMAPMSIGVAEGGSLVPTRIPAGEGRGVPSGALALLAGLALVAGGAVRRHTAGRVG